MRSGLTRLGAIQNTNGSAHQLHELFNRESCLAKNRSQCSSVQLAMIRDNNLSKRVRATKNYVTGLLPTNDEAGAGQNIDTRPP